ncbi:craniofacial development protein 2-like [Procambarus clarkii]|uniref:craniofacial development protein 2-like n=1 Tax=Procambarus clarkii TaxID=6728 RepID=UPI003742C06A
MDIAALQETRLPTTGSIREKDFTFFWQGKPPEEVREHDVGFAIRNRLLGSIVPPTEGSARIIKLQLHTAAGMVSFINANAPTLTSSTEVKDEFYDDLGLTLRDIPQQETVFFLGDFNARVGSDHSSWPSCLGQFGFGKMNESGQRLLKFCCRHDLCITNSFFDTKPQHTVSWRHPRSKHWHQLDLVLTGHSNLRNVKLTRIFQSADCDTDHSLVVCRVKFQPWKIHRVK